MSRMDRLSGRLARARHPRLLALVVLGAAVGVVGTALAVAGAGLGTLGLRLAIVGYLVFVLGASGYLAFAVFERGFE